MIDRMKMKPDHSSLPLQAWSAGGINRCIGNNSGVILVTVVMLSIVFSIITVGMMGLYISHTQSETSMVDQIIADQLSVGIFYLYHQVEAEGIAGYAYPATENVNGKTFNINIAPGAAGGGINQTQAVQVQVQ